MKYIELSGEAKDTHYSIGNKARNLCHVADILGNDVIARGFSIPTEEIENDINSNIYLELEEIIRKLRLEYPLIMRSSTTVEDSRFSYAGIFESFICLNFDEVVTNLLRIKESIYTDRVRLYCERKHIPMSSIHLAIIIQEFLEVDVSGVAFTKHPVSEDIASIYTEYLFGITSGVELGEGMPISKSIKKKKTQDELAFESLRNAANKLEEQIGEPLDIEWAYGNNQLYIFQIRPITT